MFILSLAAMVFHIIRLTSTCCQSQSNTNTFAERIFHTKLHCPHYQCRYGPRTRHDSLSSSTHDTRQFSMKSGHVNDPSKSLPYKTSVSTKRQQDMMSLFTQFNRVSNPGEQQATKQHVVPRFVNFKISDGIVPTRRLLSNDTCSAKESR